MAGLDPSPEQSTTGAPPLLDVRGLTTVFSTDDGLVHAVNDVSFQVGRGETLAIVGESGSGKTVTMLSVMGLIPDPPGRVEAGEILFEGVDLLRLRKEELRRIRGAQIGMIFQEPLTSLNPVFSIGNQVAEALRAHLPLGRDEARQRAVDLLRMVRLPAPERVMDAYPHHLSGGMCQRVMLAIALACRPKLLIADEPTTALDITTQSQLIDLIQQLQTELGMSVIWITHDLGIVAGITDRVLVMYAGRVVEAAQVTDLYEDPLHPYTLGLLHCIPRLDVARQERLSPIPGSPPDLLDLPPGCPFAPRCGYALDRCASERPPLTPYDTTRARACWAAVESLRSDLEPAGTA